MAPGGTASCWELFHEVLALEYSDPAYGAVHLLTVDAHALQHPKDHSENSSPWHLLRLYVLLELGQLTRIKIGHLSKRKIPQMSNVSGGFLL